MVRHSTLLATLAPGLPRETTDVLLRGASLDPREELLDLYEWRDGSSQANVDRIGNMYFLPGFYFLALEDALKNYEAFLPDTRWQRGWLPIFADGGGNFLFIDLSERGAASIRHFRLEEVEHPVEYENLHNMLKTVSRAYQDKVFFVDSEGYLEMNDDEYASLAHELNPSVNWWE